MNDRSSELFLVHTPGTTFPQVSGLIGGVPGVSCTAAPQVGAQETGGSSTGASKFSPGWLAACG